LLRRLPGRKILLTNAPHRYSTQVLRHWACSATSTTTSRSRTCTCTGQLRPKPSKLMLRA
jgi:putative hydrolase of the HAD superfamily